MTTAWEGGEGSASRPGRSLHPEKSRYQLYSRLSGPQGWSGQVREISPPTEIQSPDRPARSQSLYRLRYPAHHVYCSLLQVYRRFERTGFLRFLGRSKVSLSWATEISHACFTSLFPWKRNVFLTCDKLLWRRGPWRLSESYKRTGFFMVRRS